MTSQAYLRLPLELRERPQWLLAGPNEKGELKVPLTVGMDGRLHPGSSTDRATWLDFEYALQCAAEFRCGLGFVLAVDDPFTCVDLDVKNQHNLPNEPDKWTTPEALSTMHYIAEQLDSYTEFSISGQGVHVWCLGKIGEGVRSHGVEVYSQERFIACTGNSLHDPPKALQAREAELGVLVASMRAGAAASRAKGLVEGESDLSDEQLMQRAWDADNGEKFQRLWRGEWVDMGYPSQSEADLSLMSMLTFYSRDNEQCRRLFRRSKLGERAKATDNDRYLDYTLRLIRGRQAREDAAQARLEAQMAPFIDQAAQIRAAALDEATRAQAAAMAQELQAAGPVLTVQPTGPQNLDNPVAEGTLPWPPGLVGDIAKFIYGAAPRPVREVAIVAALGWMAGVCGKCWVIPGSGLNLYIILVAKSAIGKEAMHTGLSALTTRINETMPLSMGFVNFDDFASGPALARACSEQSSFVNVSSEFGRKLQGIANNTNGPLQTLRTVMTHLYQKSGPASIVGGISYSKKDSNVASITGVAYSMIGETTPSTLYASLTESMMEDGFLSRFTIVEYDGQRPPANRYVNLVPDPSIVQRCQELCNGAINMIAHHHRVAIRRDEEAAEIMEAFDLECDGMINGTQDESVRQMWNRAHLKMCRVAALLAIGDSHPNMVLIQKRHVEWALDLIRRDIGVMTRRLESGDVGQSDDSRYKKVLSAIAEFMYKPLSPGYGVPAIMQRDGVVPRKYLQQRLTAVAAFAQHPYGSKRALDEAIQNCMDSGYIVEMPKDKAGEAYTFQGRCFRVVQLPPNLIPASSPAR